jgi:hypothetical protein
MKLLFAIVSLAAATVAQSIGDSVPACAASCLTGAITSTTSCAITEAACQCTAANFRTVYTAALNCVLDACGADVAISTFGISFALLLLTVVDQVLPAAEKFCLDTTGVSVSPPGGTAQPPHPAFTFAAGHMPQMPASFQSSISHTVVPPTTVVSAIPTAPAPTTPVTAPKFTGGANPKAAGSFFALGAALAVFIV